MKYFLNVGKDTGLGAANCVLSNSLKSFGKAGGLISTVVIGSIFNIVGLMKTGDWSRFGLSTGATVTSVATGYGAA